MCLPIPLAHEPDFTVVRGAFRPAPGDTSVLAPEILRNGATLPFAVRAYAVTELPEAPLTPFTTSSSLLTASTKSPPGEAKLVAAPESVRNGAIFPFAVRA